MALDSSILYETRWIQWPGSACRFLHSWKSRSTPVKATICIVHGLGEHGGRYDGLARDHLVGRGFHVLAYDQQGHGQDAGARGVISCYDALLDDVGNLIQLSRQESPDKPCMLLGHSMGGNLAINYSIRRSGLPATAMADAIVASSPLFRTTKEPKGLFNSIARAAARFAPNFRISTGLKPEMLTDNRIEQEKVQQDSLYHDRVSLRLGAALIDSGRWAIENAGRLNIPTLVTHGTSDCITIPDGTRQFMARASSACTFEFFDGQQHESFRDCNGTRVIQRWIAFFGSHCG